MSTQKDINRLLPEKQTLSKIEVLPPNPHLPHQRVKHSVPASSAKAGPWYLRPTVK